MLKRGPKQKRARRTRTAWWRGKRSQWRIERVGQRELSTKWDGIWYSSGRMTETL